MTDPLAELAALRAADLPTHGGRTLAYVYDSALPGLDEFAAAAHALAAPANGLDPTAFPSLLRLEREVVATAARLLGGGVGTVTSGGTESCLLAVLAARDSRPDVARPSVVVPETAHAAFHKAGHYFGVRVVAVPVDPVTFRADPAAMAAAVDATTVLVVASAPSYAHGVVDPVAEIAAVAAGRGVRCHVDACIGGWVLPHADVAPFDLRVAGVTSVSVDLHKYAYCPKGVSVLLHADAGLRRAQFFASADWPGYTMLNTTMQSTRSGGPVAAAWAVLRRIGDDGYRELAGRALRSARVVREGIGAIAGLRVLGEPEATLLAVAGEGGDGTGGVDVFVVADELKARGWYAQPQFAHGASPANLHLTLTAANAGHEAELLADLSASVAVARELGAPEVPEGVLAAVRGLTPDQVTAEGVAGLLAATGMGGGGVLPERMAGVNTLLAAAGPRVRERLLVEFLGVLHS
ncbi:aspartate aminotransferase family protein [Actinosynnema pretiosum subsp. pretiosum]|uniref:Aspartate aminotransferase family protein n=1 Tax=Actinosynnema pretiosum subsp. pretiosum TaxID=103721 RepID=A0AA45R4P3_9PSEU|nr:Pyridoxal-dependent decarboxylase [Actinosynnema pretiosum subsp. pretiosum]QUF04833.1 aspartate aminotransferase family protein [Actinosynnema pretiosum subsp. pretiosum]